jgi:hypothetical protein
MKRAQMSTVPSTIDPSTNESVRQVHGALRGALRTATGWIQWLVVAVSFWIAIALPLAYLPLLATGITGGEALLFAGLIGTNGVAFVVGHGHEPRSIRG